MTDSSQAFNYKDVERRTMCAWTGLPCECIRGSVAEAHCLTEAEKLVSTDPPARKWPDDFRGFGIHVEW